MAYHTLSLCCAHVKLLFTSQTLTKYLLYPTNPKISSNQNSVIFLLVLLPVPHICDQDVQAIRFEVMPDPGNTYTICPATSLVEHSDGSVDLSFAACEGCSTDGIYLYISMPSPESVHSMTFRLQETIQLVV